MKKTIITIVLICSANFAQAGWYYYDHGRLMWANKYGYVEDVGQVEAEDAQQQAAAAQQALQDKLDEINDKLDELRDAQENGDQ